jgi:murein DD-endopeptidase MepM/ murein hydrolase activator NlpD
MDFTGPVGTEIYATGDGKVIKAEFNHYGYGKEVIIDHGFGYKTIYAHLRNIKVEEGQKVKRGEVIGTLGNTGRSTGPHLHYEVRKHNRPVDPINYYFNDITAEEYEKMIATVSKSRNPMD